jgi:hypothetical protein
MRNDTLLWEELYQVSVSMLNFSMATRQVASTPATSSVRRRGLSLQHNIERDEEDKPLLFGFRRAIFDNRK